MSNVKIIFSYRIANMHPCCSLFSQFITSEAFGVELLYYCVLAWMCNFGNKDFVDSRASYVTEFNIAPVADFNCAL